MRSRRSLGRICSIIRVGRGVGEKLLRAMIVEASRRELGLCLRARGENPARPLYERLVFGVVEGAVLPNSA